MYQTGTNPAKYDSLIEGVSDAEADADEDGLSNGRELEIGTNPLEQDTDEDGLKDGEEVLSYHTDPLKEDTDGDTLTDGDDVALGFSPLLPDTNGNGILDCDEKMEQSMTQQIDEEEKPEVREVTVSFNGSGNIQTTTTIKNIYNIDTMSTEVVGLIGVPVEIETTSEFDEAVICFRINGEKVEDETMNHLAVLWYDEANNQFVIQDSIIDLENQTVSVTVQHFSKYMMVDKREWFRAWREPIHYTVGVSSPYDTVIAIDCSGSMSANDRFFDYTYRDTLYPGSAYTVNTCYRKLASENYIKAMKSGDRTAIVTFSSSASVICNLTDSKTDAIQALSSIYSSGGTSYEQAVSMSLQVLRDGKKDSRKMILLLSDGESSVSDAVLESAVNSNIQINTVYIGTGSDNRLLQKIAEKTGGEYFKAATAEDLIQIYGQIAINQTIDTTDNDGDGIPDIFEISGMRLPNGRIIYSDPSKTDTDGDGLRDGEEILPVPIPCLIHNMPENNVKP